MHLEGRRGISVQFLLPVLLKRVASAMKPPVNPELQRMPSSPSYLATRKKMTPNFAGNIEASGDGRVQVGDHRANNIYNRSGGEDHNEIHHHYHYDRSGAHPQNPQTEAAGRLPNGKDACLQSLNFGAINARRAAIFPAHPDTCDWLFDTIEFQKWRDPAYLHIHNGVFWIKGKPGSGKSTLMKHALSRYRNDFFGGHLIVAHFFNAQGETLEKTRLGMLRAIVHQLLKNDDTLYENFAPAFREKQRTNRQGNWQWHQSELEEFIFFVVKQPRSRPFLLLVDALDECDESEVRDVVNFLESLSIHAFPNNGSLRMCLSSRHYPSIRMIIALELRVEKSPDHEKDIAKYVEDMLRVSDARMEADIRKRADGIFLWVFIVVSLLNKAYDEGRTEAMRKALQDIPDDLESIFSILLSKDISDMAETILMLQWVLLSLRPLKPEELFAAVVRRVALPTSDVIQRRITTSSKGLVEVRQGEPDNVHFIHLSVRNFLYQQKRLQKLDQTLGPEPVKTSHGRLWARCWHCIEQVDTTSTSEQHMKELKCKDPFLGYAASHILDHAERAVSRNDVREGDDNWEEEGHLDNNSQCTSIEQWLQKPHRWFQWWKLFHAATDFLSMWSELVMEDNAGLLYVLAFCGLPNLFRVLLDNGADINMQDGYFGNLLQVASVSGHHEVVQLLLKKGARVNAQAGHFGNALQAASFMGKLKIVQLLLNKGANVNTQGGHYSNALYAASIGFRYGIAKLLLEQKADVNTQGGYYGNALQAAIANGDKTMAELLYKRGAVPQPRKRLSLSISDAGREQVVKRPRLCEDARSAVPTGHQTLG